MSAAPAPRGWRADGALLTASAVGVGGLLLTVLLLLVAQGEAALLLILTLALAGLVAVVVTRPTPLGLLGGVLLLQLFQLRGETGTTAMEAISGLALVAYLAHWFVSTWLHQRRVVLSLFDAAAVTWGIVGLFGGMVLGQVFGADAYDFRADVIATIPFLLYLPVRDACTRHERGPLVLATVLVVFGLVASIQSAVHFRTVITQATEVWEIADARFGSSETSITVALLLCFAGSALTRSLRLRAVLLGLVGVLLGGLILTKSRGFWVASLVGMVAIGVIGGSVARRRLGAAAALGTLLLTSVALALFFDEVVLLASGTMERMLSLATAGQDISLLNRFAENAGAWERIRVNPVLGYGWGVQATHYSLISQGTTHWAFLHNGYLALWMKTGLWGLLLMAGVWGGAIVRGSLASRSPLLPVEDRVAALGAVTTLIAFTLTVFTSNPFSIFDQMLIVTLTLALAHGVSERARGRRLDAERQVAAVAHA